MRSSLPLIGITGRAKTAADIGSPYSFATAPLDVYLSEYASAVSAAGGIPVHLPLGVPSDVLNRLDALVFAGGDDLDPRLYGQVPGPHTATIDPARDTFELCLLRAATRRDMPVLGVCRGMQLLNVALGGSLIQHLDIGVGESHGSHAYPRASRVHEVRTQPGSTLRDRYGPAVQVNSFHHQAVDRVGEGLAVTARAADGVVEGLELTGHPVLGVQWHPEVYIHDPIFEWLVESANRTSVNAERNIA